MVLQDAVSSSTRGYIIFISISSLGLLENICISFTVTSKPQEDNTVFTSVSALDLSKRFT